MDEYSKFLSMPFTDFDCKHLKFKSSYEDIIDGDLRLTKGNLTFIFSSNTNHFYVKHKGLSIKSIDRPTRHQVNEIYYFFIGEYLDFSLKLPKYDWQSCMGGTGWFINEHSEVEVLVAPLKPIKKYKSVYPTKEDAQSALAYCQLLHIVSRINNDYPRKSDMNFNYHVIKRGGDLYYIVRSISEVNGGLTLQSEEGVEILIRDNEQLLKTYLK